MHLNLIETIPTVVFYGFKLAGIHRGDVRCRLCDLQEETNNHIVFECHALERNRHELSSKHGEKTDIVIDCYSFSAERHRQWTLAV